MTRTWLLLGILSLAQVSQAGVNIRATLASDYIYRGVLQTSEGPAYQGLVEYVSDFGLYGGIWASRVDFPFDDRRLELDFFAGYQRRLSENLAVDITAIRYTYDKDSVFGDYDFSELQFTTHLFDHWSVMFAAADNWLGREVLTWTGEVTYRYALPLKVVTDFTVGYQNAQRAIDDNYVWGEFGFNRKFGPIDVRAAYTTTSGAELLQAFTPSQWYFSLSWQPDLD